MAAPVRRHDLRNRGNDDNFGLVLVQRTVAATAKVVNGTELNEKAAIATNDFPGIYRGKGRSHVGVGVARAGVSWNLGGGFQTCSVIEGERLAMSSRMWREARNFLWKNQSQR